MSKLNLFRLAIVSYLTLNVMVCNKMEDTADVIIMMFTVLMGLSYVVAELYVMLDERGD